MLAFVLGELVGFIPPAVVGATLGAAGASDAAMVLGLAAAGALEGAALGFTQSRVLARYLPALDGRAWIWATAGAAAVAWAVGMGGPVLFSSGIPLWVAFAAMIPAWTLALLAMGVAQWWVMRRVLPRCARWIPITAGAWLVGVMIPVAAISLMPDGTPAWAMVVVAVTAAIAMGVTVGALTGGALMALIRRSASMGDSRTHTNPSEDPVP
jgi:hypothetical protein